MAVRTASSEAADSAGSTRSYSAAGKLVCSGRSAGAGAATSHCADRKAAQHTSWQDGRELGAREGASRAGRERWRHVHLTCAEGPTNLRAARSCALRPDARCASKWEGLSHAKHWQHAMHRVTAAGGRGLLTCRPFRGWGTCRGRWPPSAAAGRGAARSSASGGTPLGCSPPAARHTPPAGTTPRLFQHSLRRANPAVP